MACNLYVQLSFLKYSVKIINSFFISNVNMCLSLFKEFTVCLYNYYTLKLNFKKVLLKSAISIDTVSSEYRAIIILIANVSVSVRGYNYLDVGVWM